MGVYLDLMAISDHDTVRGFETERDRRVREATEKIDRELARERRLQVQREMLDAAPSDDLHGEGCDETPCRACLIDGFDAESEEAMEDRARDLFHSGQPMGDWDH